MDGRPHGTRHDDLLSAQRSDGGYVRRLYLRLERGGFDVPVRARRRRLQRLHEPAELQRARRGLAYVLGLRNRCSGERGRHTGHLYLDDLLSPDRSGATVRLLSPRPPYTVVALAVFAVVIVLVSLV